MNEKGQVSDVLWLWYLIPILFVIVIVVIPLEVYYFGSDNSGKVIYIPKDGVECKTLHIVNHTFGNPTTYDISDCNNGETYYGVSSYSEKPSRK